MLIAEARVETERPSWYLVRFCRHASDEAQAHPETQAHVEWSDDLPNQPPDATDDNARG
jgi:hypothetical protein